MSAVPTSLPPPIHLFPHTQTHKDTHTDTQTHTHARTHAHAHAHTLSPFCRFLLRAQEEEQFSSQPERRATLAANGRISFGRVTAKQGRNGKTTTTSAAVAAVSPSLASELLHPDAMFRYLLIDVGEEGDSSLVDDAITRICAQPSGACALSVLCFWGGAFDSCVSLPTRETKGQKLLHTHTHITHSHTHSLTHTHTHSLTHTHTHTLSLSHTHTLSLSPLLSLPPTPLLLPISQVA